MDASHSTHGRHAPLAGLTSLAVFTLAFLLICGLESWARPFAVGGLYFESTTSETMMQTVSLQDLRDAPLTSLYYIHIQPPGLDALRALLVVLRPSASIWAALAGVDASLYGLWAVLYGLMGVLLFTWLDQVTGKWVAVAGSLVFLLHPATIYYASYLDTTFISAFLVLWMYILLWKMRHGQPVSMVLFSFVFLGLFFFRSIFQLSAVLVVLASLWLLRLPWRKILIFLLIAGGISGLYVARQYVLFGTLSTSSFVGLNLANSIGLPAPAFTPTDLGGGPLPAVLARAYKLTGTPNFNNLGYLAVSRQMAATYLDALRHTPLKVLLAGYLWNTLLYFQPSSHYLPHAIVDRLPWRSFLDTLFSFPIFLGLLLGAAAFWLQRVVRQRDYAAALGMLLPALYVFAASILFERGENMRFKYFLEPVMFCFILVQFYQPARLLYQRARSQRSAPSPAPHPA